MSFTVLQLEQLLNDIMAKMSESILVLGSSTLALLAKLELHLKISFWGRKNDIVNAETEANTLN